MTCPTRINPQNTAAPRATPSHLSIKIPPTAASLLKTRKSSIYLNEINCNLHDIRP
jgi:hypothetical protein